MKNTSTNSELLEAVCHSASRLIASSPGPIRRIRLQAGEVMVEVEWPDLAPGLPQQAGNGAAPVSSKQPERDDEAGLHYICAPVIGTFHRSSEPGGKPFVRDGDIVGLGQQVAILEAMKMMMPVAADRAGEVVKVLVPDATPVEYGERLIAIAPAMA